MRVTAKENGQLMLPVWTPYGSSDNYPEKSSVASNPLFAFPYLYLIPISIKF
jgi:hypothetical protein